MENADKSSLRLVHHMSAEAMSAQEEGGEWKGELDGERVERSGSLEDSSEDEVKFEDTPMAGPGIHRPKDPRSKAKYNVFSRLLLW